jgi:L-lactate dehydrogenase complex protein LldG
MTEAELDDLLKIFVESLKRNFVNVIFSSNLNADPDSFVSEALSAAADTGIIFFGGFDERKKAALAEHHIAIVRRDVVCRDTVEAYKLAASKSRFIFASSSASKTADIEGKLIWGMHGPRKFTVILEVESEGERPL